MADFILKQIHTSSFIFFNSTYFIHSLFLQRILSNPTCCQHGRNVVVKPPCRLLARNSKIPGIAAQTENASKKLSRECVSDQNSSKRKQNAKAVASYECRQRR